MSAIATRITRAERLMEIGGRGLMIIFIRGGLHADATSDIASIIGQDGATFLRRANDEAPAAFHERMRRDALTEHAHLLIFGGLPSAVDDRLLDDAEGGA